MSSHSSGETPKGSMTAASVSGGTALARVGPRRDVARRVGMAPERSVTFAKRTRPGVARETAARATGVLVRHETTQRGVDAFAARADTP